jgi:dihydroorotate dehydrogenase
LVDFSKPWLCLPPQLAHDLSPIALKLWAQFRKTQIYSWKPLSYKNLHFENPLGLSGGVDKNGANMSSWWTFGPGFIEVGTTTPLSQKPNPGKIMDRNSKAMALWNKMGFPNQGMDYLRKQLLLQSPFKTPVFVNIGKNRQTPNEEAQQDYIKCMDRLNDLADAYVLNISSPNTKSLRDLFNEDSFSQFLSPIIAYNKKLARSLPLFLKLSPDVDNQHFEFILDKSASLGIDGWIISNTSNTLNSKYGFNINYGGTSGAPLKTLSENLLAKAVKFLGNNKSDFLLTSVGGVMTPEDVIKRIELGSDLVQIYTALVFQGPLFFQKVFQHVQKKGLYFEEKK